MASHSIPSSPAPPASQSVRPKASTRPAAEEAADAASGGFAALLGGLDAAVPVAEAGDCGAAALLPAATTALPAGLGQPGGGETALFSGLLPPQLRRAGFLVAETARMDNAQESAEPAAGTGRPAGRTGAAGAAPPFQALPQAKAFRMPPAPALPGTASAHGTPLAPLAPPAAGTAVPERLEGAAGLAAALRRALEGAPAAPGPPALAQAAAQTAGGDSAAGSRTPGQAGTAVASADLAQAAAQPEGAPGGTPGSDNVPGPEGHPAADAAAEQVAYWATDTLQNAELTLAFEGRPVEVNVALEGQHAHVAFRSDQSDTRALLDAGTAQLRDLLGQEGLVLSGVSVGSFKADSRHPQGRGSSSETARSRAPARQTQASAEAPAMGERPVRAGVLTERKVDLFV